MGISKTKNGLIRLTGKSLAERPESTHKYS